MALYLILFIFLFKKCFYPVIIDELYMIYTIISQSNCFVKTKMNITALSKYTTENLLLRDEDIVFFHEFNNFPCKKLKISTNREKLRELPFCPYLVDFTYYSKTNFASIIDLRKAEKLEKVKIVCPIFHLKYNFSHNPELADITIDAPLSFFYQFSLQLNKKLEKINFTNFLYEGCVFRVLKNAFVENLTTLRLVHCNLTDLNGMKATFQKMKHLQLLDLRKNNLKEIPSCILHLKKLQDLDLCDNSISSVPEWFKSLPIQKVCLGNNNLKSFPNVICEMKSLRECKLYNNPFDDDSIFKKDNFFVLKKQFIERVQIDMDHRVISEMEYDIYQNAKWIKDIPNEFLCPISHEIMLRPMVTSNGFSYDWHCIRKWLETSDIEPKTGKKLAKYLTYNRALFSLIYSYCEKKKEEKQKG